MTDGVPLKSAISQGGVTHERAAARRSTSIYTSRPRSSRPNHGRRLPDAAMQDTIAYSNLPSWWARTPASATPHLVHQALKRHDRNQADPSPVVDCLSSYDKNGGTFKLAKCRARSPASALNKHLHVTTTSKLTHRCRRVPQAAKPDTVDYSHWTIFRAGTLASALAHLV